MDEELYTAEEVAAEIGVSVSTIHVWKHRGFIEPAGKRGKFHLYRLADAFRAEASRKREHRRKAA